MNSRSIGVSPRRVVHLGHERHFVEGLALGQVVPRPDGPAPLDGRVGRTPGLAPGCARRRRRGSRRSAPESPSKRQPWNGHADAVSLDLAADGEVRAEVRAVGIGEAGLARLGAVQHEIATEVAQRSHLTRRELVGGRHDEPAVGYGEREALVAGAHPETWRHRVEQGRVAGHRQADPVPRTGDLGGRGPDRIGLEVGLHIGHACTSSTRGPMRSTRPASLSTSKP